MKKNVLIISIVLLFAAHAVNLFGGTEWQAKNTSNTDGKVSTMLMRCYAQKGSIREEIVESSGDSNAGVKKGDYMIYDTTKNIVYFVSPKDKAYTEMSIDSISQLGGMAGQFVQMKISNPKVEVKKLAPEKILSYNCQHLSIKTSYDMETKIAFITTTAHVEQTNEIWGSDAVAKQDLASVYNAKAFKTSFKELDSLLQKQMDAYKNLGFVLKSVLTQKTTDQDKKTQTMTNEMKIENIASKDLNADLFKVPAGYKKNETEIPKEADKGKKAKGKDAEPEEPEPEVNPMDVLKGLF